LRIFLIPDAVSTLRKRAPVIILSILIELRYKLALIGPSGWLPDLWIRSIEEGLD
jgi:hypothetical protein